MAIRKKTSTTRLPQTLREEIYGTGANGNDHPYYHLGRHPKSRVNRKELRKQGRTSQKQKKADHFSQSHCSGSALLNHKKRPPEVDIESPRPKKARRGVPSTHDANAHSNSNSIHKPPKESKTTPSSKPSSLKRFDKEASTSKLSSTRTQKEDEEEKYIEYLERKLGYAKGSKKKKSEDKDDGLDDLLGWADTFTTSLAEGHEDDSVIDRELGDSSDEESEEAEEPERSSGYEEEWKGVEMSSDPEYDIESQPEVVEDRADEALVTTPAPGVAYIPPHMRKIEGEKTSEAMMKLTRQLKGLLNRMTEQNIANIVASIEEVYRNQRRNDVTSTLTTLIIDGISSHSSLLDSYVVLHGAFVSCMHKLVGIEFAAHFVQNVISSYEKHYAALDENSQQENDDHGKECSNLIVMISELYNFQVISCVLIFDIIRLLLNSDLSEFDVELLLKILRNSGQQLRQDDPSALKDIIQIVQDKVDKKEALSSRTRFMLETLTNLKNNKLKRNVTQNQGGAAVDRMKKFLSGIGKTRQVLAHEPLRISLDDLHSAETKGKWWLVGSAWGGDPLVDRQANPSEGPIVQSQIIEDGPNDLQKLARKQGMNSNIRRSIFVVLMSSDDYVDACDRLSQLNLTEVQQREIIRVLLHCCGNEKSYNPYYALVCQRLSRAAHSYKITIQFCLWDFLRDLGETKVGGSEVIKNAQDEEGFDLKVISKSRIRNVARAYAWWVAKDCVTLAILKPVDFTSLKPQTEEFLKEFFIQVLINSQLSTPLITANLTNVSLSRNRGVIEDIFIKASRIGTLTTGLVHFLTEAFRELPAEEEGLSKFLKWAVELAKDTLRAGLDMMPTL